MDNMSKEELVQVEETIEAVSADENTLICSLTGEQKKATDKEKTLQQIIRTLTSEYNFDTKNMARDYKVMILSILLDTFFSYNLWVSNWDIMG